MSDVLYLKTLEGALEDLEAIPLFGSPPPFPWEDFSKELKGMFDLQNLDLSIGNIDWKAHDKLLAGLGKGVKVFHFSLSPLEGTFQLLIPKESLQTLIQQLLSSEISDTVVQEGYFQFALLNIIESFNRVHPFKNLSVTLENETPLPQEGAFSIDLFIECNEKSTPARILCSKDAMQAFKAHFERERPSFLSNKALGPTLLTCILEGGSTTISSTKCSGGR